MGSPVGLASQVSIRAHNGHHLSANFDVELGAKQEQGVDEWEKWTIDTTRDGNVVLRYVSFHKKEEGGVRMRGRKGEVFE